MVVKTQKCHIKHYRIMQFNLILSMHLPYLNRDTYNKYIIIWNKDYFSKEIFIFYGNTNYKNIMYEIIKVNMW